MNDVRLYDAKRLIEQNFESSNIPIAGLEVREYPEETIFIALVEEAYLSDAIDLASTVDDQLSKIGFSGFVTIRRATNQAAIKQPARSLGVRDSRTEALVELLNARSRASENQPGLSYIPDAAANLATAMSPRNHLVFGRRGAGKTSLLVEAKRKLELNGQHCVWLNIQTYRSESPGRVLLWFCKAILDGTSIRARRPGQSGGLLADLAPALETINRLLGQSKPDELCVQQLIPRVNSLLKRIGDANGKSIYVFLDDFHYLKKIDQPAVLDLIHGCTRDAHVWLKVACIRSLSRWFQPSPPLGLQTGHDANHIDLDLTLENPSEAKLFLEKILRVYTSQAGFGGLGALFAPSCLDRLVLASGGVPRDHLVLAGDAIRVAKARANAKLVGVQDVNRAAGNRAKIKISELHDDSASIDSEQPLLKVLDVLRTFCLQEEGCTYFRVSFRDKEHCSAEYGYLTELVDVRLSHLISPSVSDERRAGERAEVFMLDLSQFSGQRLKKALRVLDLETGQIVEKRTGKALPVRRGDTPNRLLSILRRGPLLQLSKLG